jgi:hypothetical protein
VVDPDQNPGAEKAQATQELIDVMRASFAITPVGVENHGSVWEYMRGLRAYSSHILLDGGVAYSVFSVSGGFNTIDRIVISTPHRLAVYPVLRS